MNDFWLSCGHHLLDRDEGGGLVVTDDFLKVYLARPELIPPPEACAVERTLHGALLADPRMPVAASDIAAIADADARENWQMLIAFRDHLLRHKTLEAAYVDLVRRGRRQHAAAVRQPARARDPAQRARRRDRAARGARRRIVLPHPARDPARRLADRRRRGNRRRRQYTRR